MDQEFFNMYVERLVTEIIELTKMKLLVETKLQYVEKVNKLLSDKVTELENNYDHNKEPVKLEEEVKTKQKVSKSF